MKKWNRFGVKIEKFINQEIIFRNTDYYLFKSPYLSKPRLFSRFFFLTKDW